MRAALRALGVMALLTSACTRGVPGWKPLEAGVEAAELKLPGGTGAHALKVNLEQVDLRVIDARNSKRQGANVQILRKEMPKAIAVINGGFFANNQAPMGLVLSGGQEKNPLRKADWGVFWVAGTLAGVVHTDQWRKTAPPGVQEALQVGPRLVVGGKALTFKKALPAPRSVVCVRSPSHIVLLVSDAIELEPLAAWLAREVSAGGLGCANAINFDGGPSTQLSIKSGRVSWEISTERKVPTALGVFRRGP